jgi:hypothetical protein
MSEREAKLIGNTDATVWATEFVKLVKAKPSEFIDEGLMLGWFANAIMAGYDAGYDRATKVLTELPKEPRG